MRATHLLWTRRPRSLRGRRATASRAPDRAWVRRSRGSAEPQCVRPVRNPASANRGEAGRVRQDRAARTGRDMETSGRSAMTPPADCRSDRRTSAHGAHRGPRRRDDPLAEARPRGGDLVQIFLGDPQGWKEPGRVRGGADALRAAAEAGLDALRARAVPGQRGDREQPDPHPQPQAARPARAGGGRDRRARADRARRARLDDDDPQVGFDNWRKAFERGDARRCRC